MLGREELKELRTEFWTAFGIVMKPHHSETGFNVRWTNYRTGVKDLYFRLDMEGKRAVVAIDFQHSDEGIRDLFWEQFNEYKAYFHSTMEEEWIWDDRYHPHLDIARARVWNFKEGVSLYKKETWPEAFAFLKSNMIKLDSFWNDVRLTFIELSR